MNAARHAALGAVVGAGAAVAPDVLLLTFGWRKRWLSDQHPLVMAHRLLHNPRALVVTAAAAGWASHVLADQLIAHRTGPGT